MWKSLCCVLEKSGRIEHEPVNGVDDNFVSMVKSSQKYVAQFVDAAYQRRRNILYT